MLNGMAACGEITWERLPGCVGQPVLDTKLKAARFISAVNWGNAMNETERQPGISLGLARVYLNATDPKLATRTWQDVMDDIVAKKKDETLRRWEVAIKDKNFDCIRRLTVAETRPEHFDRALADGKVSTNVYLRRIHNHPLGMEWLLESVIPRGNGLCFGHVGSLWYRPADRPLCLASLKSGTKCLEFILLRVNPVSIVCRRSSRQGRASVCPRPPPLTRRPASGLLRLRFRAWNDV